MEISDEGWKKVQSFQQWTPGLKINTMKLIQHSFKIQSYKKICTSISQWRLRFLLPLQNEELWMPVFIIRPISCNTKKHQFFTRAISL